MAIIRQKFSAIVEANNDHEFLGRIRVLCRNLAAKPLPWWFRMASGMYSKDQATDAETGGVASGWFLVPEKDSRVMIEVAMEDTQSDMPAQLFIADPDPVYFPTAWSEKSAPDSQFREEGSYPQRRGYRSPGGALIVFDDNDGAEAITITHHNTTTFLTMLPDGKVKIHGSEVWIDQNANEHLVGGESLISYLNAFFANKYNAHIHGTAVGPSSAPNLPQDPAVNADFCSDDHKVKGP